MPQSVPRPRRLRRRPHSIGVLALTVLAALIGTGTVLPSAVADRGPSGPAGATRSPEAHLHRTPSGVELEVAGGGGAPGYRIQISRAPFEIRTVRGGDTVLRTAATSPASFEALLPTGLARATRLAPGRGRTGAWTSSWPPTSPAAT